MQPKPKPSLCIVHTSDIIYLCYVLLFVSGFFLFLSCFLFTFCSATCGWRDMRSSTTVMYACAMLNAEQRDHWNHGGIIAPWPKSSKFVLFLSLIMIPFYLISQKYLWRLIHNKSVFNFLKFLAMVSPNLYSKWIFEHCFRNLTTYK